MKIVCLSLISSTLLMSCASTTVEKNDKINQTDVDEFINAMMGEFETHPENSDTQILDRRVRVNSANLSGDWVYAQLNTGPEKKLYRQRVSNIDVSDDGTAIIQRSYTLKYPEAYSDFWNDPKKFDKLTETDINRFANEGCVQTWTRASDTSWNGYVDPRTCVINSKRRNVDIRIEAEASIDGDIYQTNERGFDMEMNQIWGSKPGEFIVLKRNK